MPKFQEFSADSPAIFKNGANRFYGICTKLILIVSSRINNCVNRFFPFLFLNEARVSHLSISCVTVVIQTRIVLIDVAPFDIIRRWENGWGSNC